MISKQEFQTSNLNNMCVKCGSPYTCNCQQQQPCGCNNTGCLVKLDTTCIIYHKNNNDLTQLTALGLTNGATLELILNTIDDYIEQLKLNELTLPILDVTYTINTLHQFATAVDTEIGLLRKYLGNQTSDPVSAVNGDYWFRTDEPVADGLKIKLNGSVRTIPTT